MIRQPACGALADDNRLVNGASAASARTSRDISLLKARCSDCTSLSVQVNDAMSSVISNNRRERSSRVVS